MKTSELLAPPVSDQDAPWANGDWEDPYEDLDGFLETAEDYQRGRY